MRSSLRQLSTRLTAQGHTVSHQTVGRLLDKLGYALHVNAKKLEASAHHPDRNVQFEHIAAQRATFEAAGWPIISADTEKKELIGDFKNVGATWSCEAAVVNVYNFPARRPGPGSALRGLRCHAKSGYNLCRRLAPSTRARPSLGELFLGDTQIAIPIKKPRKSKGNPNPQLTDEQKAANKAVSQVRIFVEHAIGGLKRYNILVQRFRNHKENFEDDVIGIAAGLWNFALSY